MDTQMKVGSKIVVPIPASWQVVSADSSTVSISVAGGKVTAIGLKAGTTWLTVTLAGDLKVMVQVTVTAN